MGYNDWRVPTIDELKTLLTKKSYSNSKSYNGKTYIKKPLLDSMDMEYQRFWSATTNVNRTDNAWYVYFYFGNDSNVNKANSYYVRCVR